MIFQRLLHWLRQPFPLLNDPRRIWRMVVVGFLFVTFFLYFFQPFGLRPDPEHPGRMFQICLEYGLVTMIMLLVWGLGTRLLPYLFQEEKWQVWKEILSNLVVMTLIAMANLIYTHFRYDAPLSWRLVWKWQIVTWGVGIFPTLYGVFHKQLRLMQRFSMEASFLSGKMDRQPEYLSNQPAQSLPHITLQGENQGESLELTTNQIYYLAAADNYVQVFYLEKEQLKNRMLRSTLKKMEDALASYPQFFRCHRTYLVNLDKVQQVCGNAQGYRLQLTDLEETVPVSRNLNGVIQTRLGQVE